jgi:hypothetical protein
MGKKILGLLVGFVLLLVSVNAYSATKWSGYTTITNLLAYKTQLAFVVEYADPTYSTCDGGRRFSLDPSSSDYKTQAAVLTAAYLANKRINFNYSIDSANCNPFVYLFYTAD